MQEVLTLIDSDDGVLAIFHRAKPVRDVTRQGLDPADGALGLGFDDHGYKPGGGDQFRLFALFEDALTLMGSTPAQEAMMLLYLRLMRKGPSYWSHPHCLDLVDHAHEAFRRAVPQLGTGVSSP